MQKDVFNRPVIPKPVEMPSHKSFYQRKESATNRYTKAIPPRLIEMLTNPTDCSS